MKHFNNVNTIEELKKEYKRLTKKFHPDLNRDTDTTKIMVEVNNEYEQLFKTLENETTKKAGHSVNDNYRDIINNLMKHEGIVIDLVGTWLWISGNTFNVKEELKELGFKWSKSNKKWYLGEVSGKRKKAISWQDKINKYGQETLVSKGTKQYIG